MDGQLIKCPNCNGILDDDGELDFVFCKYCGHKIVISGLSDTVADAKVRIKDIESKERMFEKELEYKERMDDKEHARKDKEDKKNVLGILGIFAIYIVLMLLIRGVFSSTDEREEKSQREEEKLQSIVTEIMVDIDNGDFTSAYVKANTLYYTTGYSDEIEEKWDNTRQEVINRIIAAEIEATGKSTYSSSVEEDDEDKDVLDWLFG